MTASNDSSAMPTPRYLCLALVVTIAVAVYVSSYLVLRSVQVETWGRDGQDYLIVPTTFLYYFYRPIMYVDGAATGMRFHVGPHRD